MQQASGIQVFRQPGNCLVEMLRSGLRPTALVFTMTHKERGEAATFVVPPGERCKQRSGPRLIIKVQPGRAQCQITPFIGRETLQHTNPRRSADPAMPRSLSDFTLR